MKQQFLEDVTDTIRLTVYSNNRSIVPTSAYVTLYKPSGSVLQARTSATIDSTTGELTYSLTTTHTADRGLNFKVVWEYVHNSVTYYNTSLFDIVRSVLEIPIVDEDLYDELESLRKTHLQAQGTATSATSSTLLDTTKRKEEDDFWKGGIIEILSGTGANQRRDITGFTKSTSTINISPNWTSTPSTDSVYRVVKSFTNKIRQCFDKLETMIYNKGKRHQLILESSQIKFPLLYLTIHTICLDLMDNGEDKWKILADEYKAKFDASFDGMTLEYDEDDSGTINDEETSSGITSFTIGRS